MKILAFSFLFVGLLVVACQNTQGSDGATADNSSTAQTAEPEKAGPDGEKIYKTYCVTCHGIDGAMGLNGAKPIGESVLELEERITLINNGKNQMTAFKGILDDDQIKAVAEYTLTAFN